MNRLLMVLMFCVGLKADTVTTLYLYADNLQICNGSCEALNFTVPVNPSEIGWTVTNASWTLWDYQNYSGTNDLMAEGDQSDVLGLDMSGSRTYLIASGSFNLPDLDQLYGLSFGITPTLDTVSVPGGFDEVSDFIELEVSYTAVDPPPLGLKESPIPEPRWEWIVIIAVLLNAAITGARSPKRWPS
jgi:hypothetical protein